MTTSDLVKVNKEYFETVATTAVKSAVYTALPYLNIPPLNFLINQLIEWAVSKIADALEMATFFIYVDLRVTSQGKEYVISAHEANKNPTPENIKAANEAFKRFVNFSTV